MGTDEPPPLARLGAWITPTDFEFFTPIVLGGTAVRRVNVSALVAAADVSAEMVLEAFIDPLTCDVMDLEEITCSKCGMKGFGPPGTSGDILCTTCTGGGNVEH